MAKLIFNFSAMNSGKTMDLIRTAYNYEENGLKTLVMKPVVDTKGGDKIITRAGLTRDVDIKIGKNDNILKLLTGKTDGVECIFIDEAQFLQKKQVKDLLIFCNTLNIPVICYGLRTDFKGELFTGSAALFAYAEEVHEFKTLCRCKEIARYNSRKVNGEYITSGSTVLIDGTQDVVYEPLCAKCFVEKVIMKDYMKNDHNQKTLESLIQSSILSNKEKPKQKVLKK